MRAGQLRHRVQLESATETVSAHGDVTRTWDGPMLWASVEPLNGREFFNAQQVDSNVTHRIRMRHRDDITADKRIRFGTRYFNFSSVINPEERNAELVIMATENTGKEAV